LIASGSNLDFLFVLCHTVWLVDSFLNEGGREVKARFRVVDFNLLCGIEGIALMTQQNP
jgi:hypothetical protein